MKTFHKLKHEKGIKIFYILEQKNSEFGLILELFF